MAPGTDRTQYREALASLVLKTQARFPALNGRLTKATKLALLDDVELHADGTATVHSSSDPTRHYRIVEGVCDCRDFERAPERLCAHRLAAGLVRKANALLPQSTTVKTGPAPGTLPEAAVSITLKANFDGQEVLVTLRGTDFPSVKAQVEEASVWLKAHAPTPQPPPAQGQGRSGVRYAPGGDAVARGQGGPQGLVLARSGGPVVQRQITTHGAGR